MHINEHTASPAHHVPKASIIVPNYNYARYLEKRMESFLNQTYQDFEIIILDDASTDNSREIIETYRTCPKVSRIVYNKSNTGIPCSQWRKGWELSRGEYIWIAEADDLADCTFLEKAVRELDADSNVSLFFSTANIIDSEGKPMPNKFRILEPRYHLKKHECTYRFSGEFFLKHYLAWNNCIYNASGVVFRKDSVSVGDWDETEHYRNCGDWILWSKIAEKGGGIAVSAERLNYFRLHQSSATIYLDKNNNSIRESLMVIRNNLKFLPEWRKKVILGTTYLSLIRYRAKSSAQRFAVRRIFVEMFGKQAVRESLIAGKANRSFPCILRHEHISQKKDHCMREATVGFNLKHTL